MITLKFPINISEEDKSFIKNLQKQQTSLIGVAYNAIKKYNLS